MTRHPLPPPATIASRPNPDLAARIGGTEFWLKTQLGFHVETANGAAVATLNCDERHLNPNGVVHGAVIFALVDTAMGAATMSVVPPGAHCATIEIHQRFLAPVLPGPMRAEINVIKAGRRIIHLSATVTNGTQQPIALATGTFAVIECPHTV